MHLVLWITPGSQIGAGVGGTAALKTSTYWLLHYAMKCSSTLPCKVLVCFVLHIFISMFSFFSVAEAVASGSLSTSVSSPPTSATFFPLIALVPPSRQRLVLNISFLNCIKFGNSCFFVFFCGCCLFTGLWGLNWVCEDVKDSSAFVCVCQ